MKSNSKCPIGACTGNKNMASPNQKWLHLRLDSTEKSVLCCVFISRIAVSKSYVHLAVLSYMYIQWVYMSNAEWRMNNEDHGLECQTCSKCERHTLGTVSAEQWPSVTSRSRISHAKIDGQSVFSRTMCRTTSLVATRGLLPPIARGRYEPVS